MNMRTAILALGAISALCVVVSSGPSSAATLIGSSVSGQALFGTSPNNWFDPGHGFVPAGFGNSAPNGPNNVIIGSEVEFGHNDGDNKDTADFTGNSVTLQDDVESGSTNVSITMIFTDTLFAGATVTLASDTFPVPVIDSLVGDVLTLSVPAASVTPGETYDATFNIITPGATMPLPATLPRFASGLSALGLLGWRRKRKARVSLLGAA